MQKGFRNHMMSETVFYNHAICLYTQIKKKKIVINNKESSHYTKNFN